MGHPRRHYRPNSLYLITNRLAEGLPFVPNEYIRALLGGIFAEAHRRFPSIELCLYLFLQNHYHLLARTTGDPADLRCFLEYIDGEIAKIVVRLLGKRNVKVWAQRAHVALIATAEDALEKMAYALLNPVAANFCETTNDWEGFSSAKFLHEGTAEYYKRIYPRQIEKLPNGCFSKRLRRALMQEIEKSTAEAQPLSVQPFSWKVCFAETRNLDERELLLRLQNKLAIEEARYKRTRRVKPLSKEELARQNPHKRYRPRHYGRRVYCICCNKELREQLIREYRAFCEICQAVWSEWKLGILNVNFPPGAFRPARAPQASIFQPFYFS